MVARFNGYRATPVRSSSNVSDLLNQANVNFFNHFANLPAALSRMEVDSTLFTRWEGTITDTNDIRPRGFDAELILNPTRA